MNLAPNGKPSNLTPKQYALVRTPAFKAWFGDWENSPETSSKVVDFNGEPLVVYHGTERPDAILISGVFIPYGSELKELYFTNNINTALSYTYDSEAGFDEEDEEEGFNTKENIDNVIKVFLNIKNPKVKDFKGKTFTDFWNIKKDNDGNILANVYDVLSIDENLKRKDYLGNTYIVYKSEQIKLADGTNTTFDANNPDIRYKNGGLTMKKPKAKLLAPNGKPSNLTPEQYKLVRTPEFKAWFGDWENSPETASKILDDNGEPLVCYHGSNNDFNEFRSDVGYSHDKGFYGRGFYFTFNPDSKWMVYAKDEAGYYGSKIKDFFIQSFSPFDISELSKYKGVRIGGYVGTESIVFLSNIAKMFPQLSDKIEVEQKKWNKVTQEYDFIDLPISVLPNLIEEYSKKVKTFITEDNWGNRNKVSGYVKAEIVEYDYTSTGGTKGSYESMDTLGTYDILLKKEEIEILLICDAIEKYDGIDARYQPEGYMTRFPEITDAIKETHDSILQTKYGDELVVFKPTQIKLSDGTNTTFDSNNPDIRYNEGGGITQKNSFNNRFKNSKLVGGNIESVKSNDFVELKYIQNGKKLGYLNYYFDTDGTFSSELNYKNELYIDMVEVKSQYRGKGIAKQLINKAIEDAKKLGIQVVTLKRDVGMGCQYGSEYDTYLKKIYSSIGFVETWTEKESEESGGEKNICAMHYTTFDSNNPDIRYAEGGSIPDLLSSQEVEYKLGRKLDWWNDDIVYLSGIEYKKVYLRPEYKKVIE